MRKEDEALKQWIFCQISEQRNWALVLTSLQSTSNVERLSKVQTSLYHREKLTVVFWEWHLSLLSHLTILIQYNSNIISFFKLAFPSVLVDECKLHEIVCGLILDEHGEISNVCPIVK
jgi:hypothetical protein